jgi:hypothetical protein
VLLLVSLTEERAIYFVLELDRRWTEMSGVNPLDGTNYLDTVSAFIEGFLHLLAGEEAWGRGRHLTHASVQRPLASTSFTEASVPVA